MIRSVPVLAPALLALVCAGVAAGQHNHLTVDTASGVPGDQTLIRAGYYPSESAYSIAAGRLLRDGEVAVYPVPDVLAQAGPLGGWHAGNDLLLTSDFYFATGRLSGGHFAYELAEVRPVSGGPGTFAWGVFTGGGALVPLAVSSGATREERSFFVAAGGHNHQQGYALTGGWVLDLTLIAWDANGRYADSAPVTVRFDTGACPADFNRAGGLTVQDLFDFLDAWFAASDRADFNHAGGLTVQDLFDFLEGWFAGC